MKSEIPLGIRGETGRVGVGEPSACWPEVLLWAAQRGVGVEIGVETGTGLWIGVGIWTEIETG